MSGIPPVVLIQVKDPSRRLAVTLGPDLPTYSDAWGGWSEQSRPRKTSLTEYTGPAAAKGSLNLLFDGYAAGRSVRAQLDALYKYFAPSGNLPAGQEPPAFTVLNAHPIPSKTQWVVSGLAYGEQILSVPNRGVLRQYLTLSLLQYVPGDVLVTSSSAAQRATGGGSKAKTYTVRAGDTGSKIAAALLGDASKWPSIAALNSIRDPNRLVVGKTLRLP